MALITDTYSDEDRVKSFLVLGLYDAAALTANITTQAKNAKDEINTYIGREEDFTVVELAETKNAGIVLAASQWTACLMELKRQERAPKIAEETKIDCTAAEKRLIAWCHNNGITPASEKKAKPTTPEILFAHSAEESVI